MNSGKRYVASEQDAALEPVSAKMARMREERDKFRLKKDAEPKPASPDAPAFSSQRDEPKFEHDGPYTTKPPGQTGQRDGADREVYEVERSEAHAPRFAVGWKTQFSPDAPQQPSERLTLPQSTEARKNIPLASGVLDYFPAALAEVAKVSKAGNDKHNPGQPLHWARAKSMDQADCIARHLLERGGIDPETGQRHSAQMAWRALALLQLELEAEGAPMARGAR